PDQIDYEESWTGDVLPTVRAVSVDRDATVEVEQPTDADPVSTIVVTAPGGATRTYTVTFDRIQPPVLEATAATSIRCIAGKAHVVLTVTNSSDVPLDVVATTSYGAKSFSDLAPGK